MRLDRPFRAGALVAWLRGGELRTRALSAGVPARSLVIKVTAGKDDPERCNQAFTVAAAAVASGVQVSLWLTGESAWFALPGRAADFSLPHATPLADLLAAVLGRRHGDGVHAVRGAAATLARVTSSRGSGSPARRRSSLR